jgi:hypothetical protein
MKNNHQPFLTFSGGTCVEAEKKKNPQADYDYSVADANSDKLQWQEISSCAKPSMELSAVKQNENNRRTRDGKTRHKHAALQKSQMELARD